MVEENKGEPNYINPVTGRDHGHTKEGASWGNLLGELGPSVEIKGSQLG